MATVLLKNTREHDITINAFDDNGELVQVVVPGARPSEFNKEEIAYGTAEADDAFIDAAKKKSKAVAHYFEQGWLVVVKSDSASDSDSKKTTQSKKQQ